MGGQPFLTVLSLSLASIFANPFARADSALFLNRASAEGSSSVSEGIELVCVGSEIARSVCRVAQTRGDEGLASEAVASSEAELLLRDVSREFARMPAGDRSLDSPRGPVLRVALDFEGRKADRVFRVSKSATDLVPIIAIEVKLTRKLKW